MNGQREMFYKLPFFCAFKGGGLKKKIPEIHCISGICCVLLLLLSGATRTGFLLVTVTLIIFYRVSKQPRK